MIKYLAHTRLMELEKEANEHLKAGWELHGTIVIDNEAGAETLYIQAITKL